MTKDERIRIPITQAQVIGGQTPREASETQAQTTMLGENLQAEPSPLDNSSAPKTLANQDCGLYAASVQGPTIGGEADIQMQTRELLPEAEPKINHSSSKSSLSNGS